MGSTQLILLGVTLLVFAGMAYGMSRSIAKYEEKKKKMKKKKGNSKYLKEFKNPGR